MNKRQRAIAKRLTERLPTISRADFELHASKTMPRNTPQVRYSAAVGYLGRKLGHVTVWENRKPHHMVIIDHISDAYLDAMCDMLGAPHVHSVAPQLPARTYNPTLRCGNSEVELIADIIARPDTSDFTAAIYADVMRRG